MARPKPEPEPVVRRHDVERLCACVPRPLRLLNRILDAFANDRGDDRARPCDRAGDDARDVRSLARRQREHFTRVTVSHHADHTRLCGKPACERCKLLFVDRKVRTERHCHRRNETVEVCHCRHVTLLLCELSELRWGNAGAAGLNGTREFYSRRHHRLSVCGEGF